jgi:ABC-type Fe3+/spermidine/putrescine transport system ATPase subunit
VSTLSLRHISKTFGAVDAVHDISFDVAAGEFFSILGPSGCGKTTLLRMIAGFETPTGGSLMLDGKDITAMLPQHRGIGMVFQNYALFPHMNVFQNVAFGLETQKRSRREIEERVGRVLDAVQLPHKAKSPVPELSGGEQQRVAVARAIVVEPAVLLFDEPLSNLDVSLRLSTRKEIREIQRRTGITTVYVTHDQSEALSLSDRIAVMARGRAVQVGSPQEVYENPANGFVAGFLGGATLLRGTIAAATHSFAAGSFTIAIPGTTTSGACVLAIRPESVIIDDRGEFSGRLIEKEYQGFTTSFLLECQSVQIRGTSISSEKLTRLRVGDTVAFTLDRSKMSILDDEK